MIHKLLLPVSILMLLAACAPQPALEKADVCPVTVPSQQAVALPTQADYDNRFWYGTPALWTNLPADGIWQDLPNDEAGYVQKTVFWREGFDAIREPQPALTVSGRRLDAPAPTFTFSDATHGWDETGNFMLMGISIPTEGCWEITATYQQAQLSFVVSVLP